MENIQQITEFSSWMIVIFVIVVVWDFAWKLIALWKAAKNNHISWFVCIGILNTLGILPIVYILNYDKKKQ